MYEEIETDGQVAYFKVIILSVFQKEISFMSLVCWFLSNKSWICLPVLSNFEGCQIPTH